MLTGVLHSILFHWLFGAVKPKTFEVLDVTMVYILVSVYGGVLDFLFGRV